MENPIFARDMDLVRGILIWAEHGGDQAYRPGPVTVPLCHHVNMMVTAELVEGLGKCHRKPGTNNWEPDIAHVTAITWKGSEFLEAARNEQTWTRAKAQLSDRELPVMYDLLREAAHGLAIEGRPELDLRGAESALRSRSAHLARCSAQFLETLEALAGRGQRNVETIWNAAFHVNLVDNDLSACLYFTTTTDDVWSQRTVARTLAVMLAEAVEDFLELYGKGFMDACTVAGVFEEFEQSRRDVLGRVNAFKNEHGDFLRTVRNTSGAHRELDAVEFIRNVAAANPQKLNDLACQFLDLVKDLGAFSMAVIERTTALYRERGVIP